MADRYTYLPSVGIFIMVTWGAAEITSKLRYYRIVQGISAGLVFTALFICTSVQITYWQNNATLFKHAVEVANSAIMHERYATAVFKEGNFDEAIIHYKQSLKIEPDNVGALNNYAWLRATQINPEFRDPDQAVQLAQRACEQTEFNQPIFLDTLAVAYAAAGDFRKAIETEKKALELCQLPTQKKVREQLEERLALFKAGKPYVEGY
jgi:tetratricopeptide (TPR) repeat protein